MQVFTMFIFPGTGIAFLSYIYIAFVLLIPFTMCTAILAQRKYRINSYGDDYKEYIKNSIKYFLFL
jgi:protein-S-isoprenylcysteine O-methyltransferase Ste14